MLRGRNAGFTLLEIMLAAAILSIIAAAVYQFTDVSLQSARFYAKTGDQEAVHSGLRRLLETELANLPAGESGVLLGLRAHSGGNERDSMQLVCAPGNGVLAADAHGNYEIVLAVRETPRKSGRFSLGIERRPHEDDDDDDDDDDTPTTKLSNPIHPHLNLPADWVPLIDGVRSLEINYFDSRLNGWVEKWTDQTALPNLVRVRFETDDNQAAYEFVAQVPSGGPRQPLPTFNAAATTRGPGTAGPVAPGPGTVTAPQIRR